MNWAVVDASYHPQSKWWNQGLTAGAYSTFALVSICINMSNRIFKRRTNWVTSSLLELLIAAKNASLPIISQIQELFSLIPRLYLAVHQKKLQEIVWGALIAHFLCTFCCNSSVICLSFTWNPEIQEKAVVNIIVGHPVFYCISSMKCAFRAEIVFYCADPIMNQFIPRSIPFGAAGIGLAGPDSFRVREFSLVYFEQKLLSWKGVNQFPIGAWVDSRRLNLQIHSLLQTLKLEMDNLLT